MIKFNWTFQEVRDIYLQNFLELIYQAQSLHRKHFSELDIQKASLVSLKTGGCSEDCAYCAQSSRHRTEVKAQSLLDKEQVLKQADQAKQSGSTRLCMGTAWKGVKDSKDFEKVLDIVSAVKDLGMEVCCTLGMLSFEQAERLKQAGCDYYNHNIDTAEDYYPKIVTSHSFEDRLNTIKNVRGAGLKLCCGGIIGMGETPEQRIKMLQALATQNPHPESVPINLLIPIAGTPLENQERLDAIEFVRTIATARILMPASRVRLSAGRNEMSDELQTLCFVAGANSIHTGEKLLTAKNSAEDRDQLLFQRLGLRQASQ